MPADKIKRVKEKAPPAKTKSSPATMDVKELPVRKPGGREHRSFVLYGRSGTGKTTIAGTFPTPILVLDVKDVGDDSLVGVEDLDVMDVGTWDDFEIAYWFVKRHPERYKTIVIDTVSQLQQLAIRKVLDDKGRDSDRAGEWGVMTKQMWGDVASIMKSWIINLRDLPMEVVFIAQDRTFNVGEEDEDNGLAPEVGPALSPSIAKALNAAVHFIANTFIRRRLVVVKVKDPPKGQSPRKEVERIEYCIRIGPNPVYITKVRKPRAITPPSVVVDPTYEKLMAITSGEKQ